jgi:hypothetical protein
MTLIKMTDKFNNIGSSESCDQVIRGGENKNDVQEAGERRSILRQRPGKPPTSSGPGSENNEQNKSVRRSSVVKWANHVMPQRRSSNFSSTNDGERKSRRDSFWTR